jgi:hypothetical protein
MYAWEAALGADFWCPAMVIVNQPSKDIPMGVTGCLLCPCIYLSHCLQALSITGKCPKCCLSLLSGLDLLLYSANRPGFNEARRRYIGPVFAALGRIHLVGYREVKAMLTRPQFRGSYLGRAKLDT